MQPCGGRPSQRHKKKSLLKPVHLSKLSGLIPQEILNKFPNGYVYMWGNTRGKKDINWNGHYVKMISEGDVAFFIEKDCICLIAVVLHTFCSAEVSMKVWEEKHGNGLDFENIMILDKPIAVNIQLESLNQYIGRPREARCNSVWWFDKSATTFLESHGVYL
jgi:hypothetical protein